MSVSVQAVSLLSMVDCLIASEAYLFARLWRRAHFPAPLEQPLVGRGPEQKDFLPGFWIFVLRSCADCLWVGANDGDLDAGTSLCMNLRILAILKGASALLIIWPRNISFLQVCHKSCQHCKEIFLSFRPFLFHPKSLSLPCMCIQSGAQALNLGSCCSKSNFWREVSEGKAKGSSHSLPSLHYAAIPI